jgi:hypothetical protein
MPSGTKEVAMPRSAVHAGPLDASAHRLGDAAVLTLVGGLDPAHPLPSGSSIDATLRAVDRALDPRPSALVVDLAEAELSRFVVGLLGLVRRRTRRIGVPLLLAAVPPSGEELLARVRVSALYPVFPTVGAALTATGLRSA